MQNPVPPRHIIGHQQPVSPIGRTPNVVLIVTGVGITSNYPHFAVMDCIPPWCLFSHGAGPTLVQSAPLVETQTPLVVYGYGRDVEPTHPTTTSSHQTLIRPRHQAAGTLGWSSPASSARPQQQAGPDQPACRQPRQRFRRRKLPGSIAVGHQPGRPTDTIHRSRPPPSGFSCHQ